MKSRYRIITAFLLVQSIGIACSWLWEHVPADAGVPMWGAAMVMLIPGNFMAAWIVEKLLWRSGLSLASMGIFSTLLLFAVNALVWFALVKVLRVIRSRRNASASSMQ